MVSIDFWDTLARATSGGDKRKKARYDALRTVANQHDIKLTIDNIEAATKVAAERFDHIWLNYHRTLTSTHLVTYILEDLNIPILPNEHHYLVTVFEESFWEGPPEIAEGAKEVIPHLAEKYPLALISDTMYSPGRVIRSFLDSEKLADHFDCFVFSNETGFSKPNPNAFYEALQLTESMAAKSYHIGDLLQTDIEGAKNVGINTVLFTCFKEGQNHDLEIKPDAICHHWSDIAELLL